MLDIGEASNTSSTWQPENPLARCLGGRAPDLAVGLLCVWTLAGAQVILHYGVRG